MKNKKLVWAVVIIALVLTGVTLSTKLIGKDQKEEKSQVENTEVTENEKDENVIASGGNEEDGSVTTEKEEQSNEEEDDVEQLDTNSGVDPFEDGPYAYITIEDLYKYGKDLDGMNIYTVGIVEEATDTLLKIKTEDSNAPIIAYIYEKTDAKAGDQVAFYGSVIGTPYGKETGSAYVNATILKVNDGSSSYKKSTTDEDLLKFVKN